MIDSIIILLLVYLPIVLGIIGILSFICFLILKFNNKKKKSIFLILSMTSINIFVLSLIMSYIKLIDTDTKNRPQYIIRRINTND